MRKLYTAIVCGKLEGEGEVNAAISGQEARTGWRSRLAVPSEKYGFVSVVELTPFTGRMHQLRRHMVQNPLPQTLKPQIPETSNPKQFKSQAVKL